MKIKYLAELGLLTMLLWLAAACSADQGQPLDSEGEQTGTEVPVSILSRLAAGQDTQLSKLRVIIFSTRNSKPYAPKILISNELVDVNQDYTTITYTGYNDIYVIGNEPVDLSKVKEPEDLKGIQMDTEQSLAASEFVFYKELLNVNVKSKNEIYLEGGSVPVSRLEVKLQHVIAKLTVDFDLGRQIFIDDTGTGRFLVFKSMELVRIPKYSYLRPERYEQDGGYIENKSFNLTNNSATDANRFKWSSGEIYLPEYLLTDNKYRMVLRISGIENGISHTYTLPIGDGMNFTSSNSTDWNITRNRHYKLKIKAINGDGEASLDVDAKVEGWSEVSIPVEIPDASFLALTTQEVDVKSLRFFTYVRFVSSGAITVTKLDGLADNTLTHTVEYDDDAVKTSGRLGLKLGNWNAGKESKFRVEVKAKTSSLFINVHFSNRKGSTEQVTKVDWATAMGYPSEAGTVNVHYYNAKYHKQGPSTGCKNYYEGDPDSPITGKGCWRLATISETQSLSTNNNLHWAIEDYDPDPTQAYVASRPGAPIQIGNWSKTKYQCKYYCVLDILPPELSDFIVSDADVTNIAKVDVAKTCTDLGTGWRLPTGTETKYVFQYAGTNGLPNNFFSDSYWGQNGNGSLFVATMTDPEGKNTTDALLNQLHTVRCVKSRF